MQDTVGTNHGRPVCNDMNSHDDSILEKLRELDAVCGFNKNDSVIVLACACIDEKINTGSGIINMLTRLGYNRRHVGAILHHNTGSNPNRFRWTRDETGAYCNTEH